MIFNYLASTETEGTIIINQNSITSVYPTRDFKSIILTKERDIIIFQGFFIAECIKKSQRFFNK